MRSVCSAAARTRSGGSRAGARQSWPGRPGPFGGGVGQHARASRPAPRRTMSRGRARACSALEAGVPDLQPEAVGPHVDGSPGQRALAGSGSCGHSPGKIEGHPLQDQQCNTPGPDRQPDRPSARSTAWPRARVQPSPFAPDSVGGGFAKAGPAGDGANHQHRPAGAAQHLHRHGGIAGGEQFQLPSTGAPAAWQKAPARGPGGSEASACGAHCRCLPPLRGARAHLAVAPELFAPGDARPTPTSPSSSARWFAKAGDALMGDLDATSGFLAARAAT